MKHLIHSLILLIAMGGCAINGNRLVEIFIDIDEARQLLGMPDAKVIPATAEPVARDIPKAPEPV